MENVTIYCPVNGWDCPYYKKGECIIDDPNTYCDDFKKFWGYDSNFYDYANVSHDV